MYSRRQGISDAQSAIDEYDSQITDLSKELSLTISSINNVVEQREATRHQLSYGLLTTSNPDDVSKVANEIGAIHLNSKQQELFKQLESDQKLLNKTLSSDLYINRDDYLHPVTGKLTKALKENNLLLSEINDSITILENAPHFKWVKRELQKKKSLWNSLMSVITFKYFYKEKRLRLCRSAVGNLLDAVDKHDELIKHKSDTLQGIDTLEQQKKPIIDAINLVEKLTNDIERFDDLSLNTLRDVISNHFIDCDLKQIILTIRDDAKVLLSKLDALKNKEKHFKDIKTHIESEIADRQERKNKIQTVLSKWRRSNKTFLSGNKTKWLVDTPAGARNRTNRFRDSYSDNRYYINRYEDYNGYSSAFCTGLMFSSFAVFASGYDVDNHVAREVYSEHSEIAELADSGEDILEGHALSEAMESIEVEAGVDDAIDSMDAS